MFIMLELNIAWLSLAEVDQILSISAQSTKN